MFKKISIFFVAFFVFANAFSQQNVIQINYIEHLALIGNDPNYPINGNYILQRNLDFTDSNSYSSPANYAFYNAGSWEGIGVAAGGYINNHFTGTFDGNNKIIKNWYLNGPITGALYNGFFRKTTNATIKNLGIVNIKLQAVLGISAGLVASAVNTNINNCFVTGNINPNGSYSTYGGLVGYAEKVKITNCYTNVDIFSNNAYMGGLIGYILCDGGSNAIKNSFSAGKIKLTNGDSYSLLVGVRLINASNRDSIVNSYSVGSFVGKNPTSYTGGLLLGSTFDYFAAGTYDTLFVKGVFSIENRIKPIKIDALINGAYTGERPNKTFYITDTVFTGSTTKNFSAITSPAYNTTYLYNAANQQYPLLYRSDSTNVLVSGQRAVYPAVVEKSLDVFAFSDSIKPIDNFTKNGNTRYSINNINNITNTNNVLFTYFSINTLNGTLKWNETIPTGEYLVEVRGLNGTESSQSWIRFIITRSSDALTSVNAQSIQFTTKDSTKNGDYIIIDSLNFVNRNFTIETWAKMENNIGNFRRIFNFGIEGFAPIVLSFPDATHLALRSNGSYKTITLPAGFNAYKWNHYAITHQENWAKLYLNGVLIDSVAGVKPIYGFNKNFIGRSYPSTTDSATTGRFSELRIWLKAHSASQIKALYNQKVPSNADSLYVYLPLTANIYGDIPALGNGILGNSASNVYGQVPNCGLNRVSNTSVKYIYDTNQQYVYGTLKTTLANNEFLQIAIKDSTKWDTVKNISNYLFSYKLPTNFISGNVFVRSIVNGTRTNRFGNTYNGSKLQVDWVGTGLKFNPNIRYNRYIRIGGDSNNPRYIIQRNKNKLADTFVNPLVGNFTDAVQKNVILGTNFFADGYFWTGSTFNYSSDRFYTISDTALILYGSPVDYLKTTYNNGNFLFIFKNNTPSGIYYPGLGFGVLNSLGQRNIYYNSTVNTLPDVRYFYVYYGDSLKAVKYSSKNYTATAYKTIATNIPTIVGNDSVLTNLRFSMLARRNGVNINNNYYLNYSNLVVGGGNRPVGVDSIFITFTGLFDEVVIDTLLFTYQYSKPKVSYQPNVLKTYSLINKRLVSNYPTILDSGGGALTYSLVPLGLPSGVAINATTGLISVANWDNLASDSNNIKVRVSNPSFSDTVPFIIIKKTLNYVGYFSNSSYRTNSTNVADYIQLPNIDLRNKAFGMDIWYKHNATSGTWHRIFDIGTGANSQGVLIAFPNANQLFVRSPSQIDTAINIPANVQINQWNHYAVSVNSSGRLFFYINGRLIFSRLSTGTTPQVIFNSNFIGRSNYGGTDAPSVAQFTDFRIWDNEIDSTVYSVRGLNNITTNGGANLIYYLPLSLPVYNQDLPLEHNYILKNAAINNPYIKDTVAYIIGNSNTFNFDKDRIFINGASSLLGINKSVKATIYNFASTADTTTKTNKVQYSNNIINNYWGITLSPLQGSNLNNQIVSISDSLSAANIITYNFKINQLPDYITYIPGDSIKIQLGNAGYVFPKSNYILNQQKPYKYTWASRGVLSNDVSLDTITGKISWTNAISVGAYPIQVNVTNTAGTIKINGLVVVGDSLKSIQYVSDSISENFGIDSTNLPYTLGADANPTYSIGVTPSNASITIHPQNGKIFWNKNVPVGLYTLKIQASNYLNTITKTIKLNIKLIAPTGLSYLQKNYTIVNTGFDTSTTNIPAPIINATGGAIKYTANVPIGCRIDSNTGAMYCKNNLVVAGNYSVVVNAQNAVGFVKDTVNIQVIATSKDSVVGYKNAYYTLNTDATGTNGDYISLPSISVPNNFSIEAWVKLKDITRNYQQIFDAGNAVNNHIVSIGTFSTTGRLFITIPTAASGNSSNDIVDTATVPRIANNTWFHIAYIKQGTIVKLYLNGTKIMEQTSVLSYNTDITQVYFGASNFANNSMLGQLDECRIWRKALSEYEINRNKTVFLTPQDDSLYVYLPLSGVLASDTNIANGTIIKNRATGALALTGDISLASTGMKMQRDSNRQIVYGTHDTTTTTTKLINVKTKFYNRPVTSDSTTTALKFGPYWATENKKIPTNFLIGTLVVSKGNNDYFVKPNPFYVYFPPSKLTYNSNNNSFKIVQSTTVYTTNKPSISTNYDSANLRYSISPAFAGLSINATTGIISINSDTVSKLYGKQITTTVTAQSGLGKTSTEVTFNILSTSIIGYNNSSVCLPNNNGADYIRIPSLDLSNANFAIEVWFKLIGSPINNKRIFDFAPGTSGSSRSGLIMYFPANQLKFGAFAQDGLINLGNADTVLKNGLNEWNKYSVFYNASTRTFFVYINGVLKQSASVATDLFTAPLISNFLANNNYADPITDGYFREFKVYKNISYTDFINNLPYNIIPKRLDNSLYYYLPLSNNNNNISYIGNVTLNNGTALPNSAFLYNSNAPNTNAIITSSNNRAFYYGDSVNQIVTGEFVDQVSRFRYTYTKGVIKDTNLPNIAVNNYSWRIRGKNIFGKFKVYSSVSPQNGDSINILIAPFNLKYATNNRAYPLVNGNSGTPTTIGTDTIRYSIDSGNVNGITINASTGVISWVNTVDAGLYKLRVLATNPVGSANLTYIVNLIDTLKGFSYTPDSIQVSASNTDSLSFLPTFVKGSGATFTILNPIAGFGINASNGRINWLNTVPIGVYKIRVQANNIYNVSVTDTITIALSNQAPSKLQYIKDTMLFKQGVYYSTPRPSIVTGGLTVRYSIESISPSNDSIKIDTTTGTIKWSKEVVGNYTIQVKARNDLGYILKTIHIQIDSTTNVLVGFSNSGLNLGKFLYGTTALANRLELPSFDLRNSDYTIESWVKVLEINATNSWRRIFEFGSGANSLGMVLGFQAAYTIGMHSNSGTDIIMNYPAGYSPFKWNHYAITLSDSLRLYINGVLIRTALGNRPSVVYDKNYLNVSNWAGDPAAVNAYKDFRVWKFARTGDEIANNQTNIANNTVGLYYYLPLTVDHYLPGENVPVPNLSTLKYDPIYGSQYYNSTLPNAAINSVVKDSTKLVTYFANNIITSNYYVDSSEQKIYGNYSGQLSDGEQLQYSLDTGNTWKNIGYSKNNVFSQKIDSNFILGIIKVRSIINNVVTGRTFNDVIVSVYPKSPTIGIATANNNGTINLTFTPNKIATGVINYKVYTATGLLVATTTQSPVLISDLVDGQSYQFKVTAVNALGESISSGLSNTVNSINILLQITTYTNNEKGVNLTPTSSVLDLYSNYTVTYQINTGYILDSIIIDNVKNTDSVYGSFTFNNINKRRSFKIYVSKIKFTISVSKNAGGGVTPNQSTINVYYGDTTTLQIIPNSGYKIDSVFINGEYQGNPSSYIFSNIQQNNTVRVVFKLRVFYKLLVEIVGNGNVSATGLVDVESGTDYTLTYSPQVGYILDSVIVNNELVNDSTNSYTFTNIQGGLKIRLVFKIKTFSITSSVKNGTISPTGTIVYNYGTAVVYNYAPVDNNYVLDSLLIDGELQINPDTTTYTFNSVEADHTIDVVFTLQSEVKYTIYINKSEGVVVTPVLAQQVGYGGSLRVTWVGNTGYIFDSLFVNGKYVRDSINSYTFNYVRGAQSIYIKYKIRNFTITSSAGVHGSINPLGNSTVNYGANKTYILLPDVGYETDSLLINGASVTKPSDNIYTFSNVTANKTIYVSFKVKVVTPPCDAKVTPNIVRVGDALKSDITTFAKQRWYLAGTLKDSTPNNTYTPTEVGVYTLMGVDAVGCESNISKKYYYAKTCITPTGRLGNGAFIQSTVIGNSTQIVIKWCTEIVQENITIKILNLEGEQVYEQKVPANIGVYIINKDQIKAINYIIEVIDSKGEVLQISDVVN